MEGESESRLASTIKDKLNLKSALLQNRTLVNKKPSVYICHNFTCQQPISDIEDLNTKIEELAKIEIDLKV